MPMSEEDEVFLERSFQRTLIVSSEKKMGHFSDACQADIYLGIGKAHFILCDADRSMETHRGYRLCESRILRNVGQTSERVVVGKDLCLSLDVEAFVS